MSFDNIMAEVSKMDLIEWARTIPPEHRVIILMMSWVLFQFSERRVYDSLFGDVGVDADAQKEDFEKSSRDLGIDPKVLSAPLLAIVRKFGKVLEAKDRS